MQNPACPLSFLNYDKWLLDKNRCASCFYPPSPSSGNYGCWSSCWESSVFPWPWPPSPSSQRSSSAPSQWPGASFPPFYTAKAEEDRSLIAPPVPSLVQRQRFWGGTEHSRNGVGLIRSRLVAGVSLVQRVGSDRVDWEIGNGGAWKIKIHDG